MTWWRWLLVVAAGVGVVAVAWHALGPVGGPAAVGGGLLTWAGAVLFGKRRKQTHDQAQARLDAAVELGEQSIAESQRRAAEEVSRGMDEHDSLAGYLNSLDDDDA